MHRVDEGGGAMAGVRRGFLLVSIGRYLIMAMNLLATLVMSRLLLPADFGVSVLGSAILAIAEAMRVLGGGAYLVQHQNLTQGHIRTSFTIGFIATIVIASAVVLSSGLLAYVLRTPMLRQYLTIVMAGYLAGPFTYPIAALLNRKMEFAKVTAITLAAASINVGVGIIFALLGFGSLSYAWAGTASAVSAMVLYLPYRTGQPMFRPSLREWRSVIGFGVHDGAAALLSQIGGNLPFLILGRFLSVEAVGLSQRALLLSLGPERVILAGVSAVALPAFARQIRDGKHLKADYLRATTMITVALWPALLLLTLLAHPIVALLLGPQWRDVAPLAAISAIALLASFPMSLHYPVLVALGGVRFLPPVMISQVIVSASLLAFAAQHGIRAVAGSMLLIVPFNAVLSVMLVRHFLRFTWAEFGHALGHSAIVAVVAAAFPAALIAVAGWGADMPIVEALAAIAVSGVGWIGALAVTRHPLLGEIRRVARAQPSG